MRGPNRTKLTEGTLVEGESEEVSIHEVLRVSYIRIAKGYTEDLRDFGSSLSTSGASCLLAFFQHIG